MTTFRFHVWETVALFIGSFFLLAYAWRFGTLPVAFAGTVLGIVGQLAATRRALHIFETDGEAK